jgi:hypothetical protein
VTASTVFEEGVAQSVVAAIAASAERIAVVLLFIFFVLLLSIFPVLIFSVAWGIG